MCNKAPYLNNSSSSDVRKRTTSHFSERQQLYRIYFIREYTLIPKRARIECCCFISLTVPP